MRLFHLLPGPLSSQHPRGADNTQHCQQPLCHHRPAMGMVGITARSNPGLTLAVPGLFQLGWAIPCKTFQQF